MIDFYSETEFKLKNKKKLTLWINYIVNMEGREPGEIMYVFCDDDYLLKLNKKFLNHDTLTDIITFDNSIGDTISGDIYISVERVKENAKIYSSTHINELHRVMIHGILHLCGYKDKSVSESKIMREKEDESLFLLNTI
jgi:rRNA maturation RNase YbeY